MVHNSDYTMSVDMINIHGTEYICKLTRTPDNIFNVLISITDNPDQIIQLDLIINNCVSAICAEVNGYIEISNDASLIIVQLSFNTINDCESTDIYNTIAVIQSSDIYNITHIETYKSDNIGKFVALEKNTSKIYIIYGKILNLVTLVDINDECNNVLLNPYAKSFSIQKSSPIINDLELSSTYISIKHGYICMKLKNSINIFRIKHTHIHKILLIEEALLDMTDTFLQMVNLIDVSPFVKNRMYSIGSSYDMLNNVHLIACAVAKYVNTDICTPCIYIQTENNIIIFNRKHNNHKFTININDKIDLNDFNEYKYIDVDTTIDIINKKYCVILKNLLNKGSISIKCFESLSNTWITDDTDHYLNSIQILKFIYDYETKKVVHVKNKHFIYKWKIIIVSMIFLMFFIIFNISTSYINNIVLINSNITPRSDTDLYIHESINNNIIVPKLTYTNVIKPPEIINNIYVEKLNDNNIDTHDNNITTFELIDNLLDSFINNIYIAIESFLLKYIN